MDWNKLKQEYISGGISYRKLAEKYEVSESTLSKRAMVEKWADLKEAAKQESNDEIIKAVGKKQGKRIEKLQSVADKMLEKIETIVDEMSAKELMPALKTLTGALKDIKDVQKSGTDVKEQLARISKLERETEGADKETQEIVIEISPGVEEYSE